MSPPARTHCQLVRLAFRAVAPGGGPARRRLSCPGRSRLATLQLRRRGGRAERRGQVEERSGAFPRGHAAGGQGTRGQQGWPRGAARGREARCRRSWYRWARSLNPTGGQRGPENAPSQLRCARFHGDAAPVSAPKLSGEQRPESPEPSAPPPRAAEPVRGAASHARPRATRTAFPGREACRPRPRQPDGALREGGVGGSRAAGRGALEAAEPGPRGAARRGLPSAGPGQPGLLLAYPRLLPCVNDPSRSPPWRPCEARPLPQVPAE